MGSLYESSQTILDNRQEIGAIELGKKKVIKVIMKSLKQQSSVP